MLVRYIRVISSRRQFRGSSLCTIQVIRTKIDVVEFNSTFDMSTSGLVTISFLRRFHFKRKSHMHMEFAKIGAEFLLLLNSNILEVLVSESYNSSFRN